MFQQVTDRLAVFGSALMANGGKGLSSPYARYSVMALAGIWVIAVLIGLMRFSAAPELPAAVTSDAAVQKTPSAEKKPVDLARMQAFHLFGEYNPEAAVSETKPASSADEELLEAEETQLDIELQGIIHASTEEQSKAIIVYKGAQQPYSPEEELPFGQGIKLSRILIDRVIIDNKGNYESLMLFDAIAEGAGVNRTRRSSRKSLASQTRPISTTSKNTSSLTDVIQLSPYQEDGEMVGFRLLPGRDKAKFAAMGFRPNDLVIGIDDIDLADPSAALKVYQILRTARNAMFDILRGDEQLSIEVSFDQS